MDCTVCAVTSGSDLLCQFHRRMLSTCSDLTPEQIRPRRPVATTRIGLVDMFGLVHPIPAVAQIGRDPETCDLAILYASISVHHALIQVDDDGITIEDQGSRNGTFVGGARVTSRTPLTPDAHLRFGAVSFVTTFGPFASFASACRPLPKQFETFERGDLHRREMIVRGVRWELSITREGAHLLGSGCGIPLSPLEGRLLRVLSEQTSARFVPSRELVLEVGFGSRVADGDNVRELVLRLRRKLAPFGLGDLLESRRLAGYRLAEHAGPAWARSRPRALTGDRIAS